MRGLLARCCLAAVWVLVVSVLATWRLPAQPLSQDATVFARRYFVAFPRVVENTTDPRFPPALDRQFLLFAYSRQQGTVVTVTPTQGDTAITRTLSAGTFSTIPLPSSAPMEGYREISNRTFAVEATAPIVLYCYVATPFGGEAWTPIPVERWGMEYRAALLPSSLLVNVYSGSAEQPVPKNTAAPGVVILLAAHDSTRVILTPSDTTIKADTITLQAKQAYQYTAPVDTQQVDGKVPQREIAGMLIQANYPIGVLSGNTRQQANPMVAGITGNTCRNMMFEWLPPTEQYGQEFVYLPTQDRLSKPPKAIPPDTLPNPAPVRATEYVRAYGAAPNAQVVWQNRLLDHPDTLWIPPAGFREVPIDTFAQALRFVSASPMQLMMHSSATSFYHDTIQVAEEKKEISYDTWSPYMVQMVPRQQWSSFAPCIAPTSPPSLEHYVSVVTDSASVGRVFYRQGANGREYPFSFNNGSIPESDLVWGTMQLLPGETYAIRGADSSARFYGVAYGVRSGKEFKRIQRDWPTEFQEQMAISYGYPLAPMRSVNAPGDTLEVVTEAIGCYDLACRVRLANLRPSGLQNIELAPGAVNTKLVMGKPSNIAEVLRSTGAEFTVTVADTAGPAHATVVITDRTGRYWTIPYSFTPTPVELSPPDGVRFGTVRTGTPTERIAVIKTPPGRGIRVRQLWLGGSPNFTITGTSKVIPAQLVEGDSLVVRIKAIIPEPIIATDTLNVLLECARHTLPIVATGASPCMQVNSLVFDTITSGEYSERELRVCNNGGAPFTLINPMGGKVLAWSSPAFSVASGALQALHGRVVQPGECVPIVIRFSAISQDTTTIAAAARVWSDSRECDSITMWQGTVVPPPVMTGVGGDAAASSAGDLTISPNPSATELSVRFRLQRGGQTTITLADALGRVVRTFCQRSLDAGLHQFTYPTEGIEQGSYFLNITSGAWRGVAKVQVVGK